MMEGRNLRSQRGGRSGAPPGKGGVKPSGGDDSSKTHSGKKKKAPSSKTSTGKPTDASAASTLPADENTDRNIAALRQQLEKVNTEIAKSSSVNDRLNDEIGEIQECQTPTKEQSDRMENLVLEQKSLLREIEALNAHRLEIEENLGLGQMNTPTGKPTASQLNEGNDKNEDPTADVTSLKPEAGESPSGGKSTDVVPPLDTGHDAVEVNDTMGKQMDALLSKITDNSTTPDGADDDDDKEIPRSAH